MAFRSEIFRFTAHPMRWGVFVETIGFALISATGWVWLLTGMFGVLVLIRNRDEDMMLAEYGRRAAESVDRVT